MIFGENNAPEGYTGPHSLFERRLCRAIFETVLTDDRIAIDFGAGNVLGNASTAEFILAAPRLAATLKVIFAPGFNIGETYANGAWYLKKGALADFLHLMLRQAPGLYENYYRMVSGFRGLGHYFQQFVMTRYFTRKVREHYDFDSVAYEMILGRSMIYTCAFFDHDEEPLEEAQERKFQTIMTRLKLRNEAIQVLDLGCGWGALERAIVSQYPLAKITGLSISANQISWARERSAQSLSAAEADRIEYRAEDYADHSQIGAYDNVVVVGMLEHVGLGLFRQFFKRIEQFLKPDGSALIHTVVGPISDRPSNRWIRQRIFSGGYIPSLAEVVRAIESTRLSITDIYLHSPKHYRLTIERWTQNLISNRKSFVRHLETNGVTPSEAKKAFRTWHFYLSAVRNLFDPTVADSDQIAQICLNKKP